MSLILPPRTRLLFIGDSITDAERARPAGEGLFDALGKGYVSQVDALLTATYPDRVIRVINQGVSGNTVRELKARWESDVLERKPDWLVVMIGINDVWRQFDTPRQSETHVLPDEYERTLTELVRETASRVHGLVLMTPFYIEPSKTDAMRACADRYGAVVRRLAEQTPGAIFVDVQAAFDAVLEHHYPAELSWDRVHPTATGHMIVARAFLQAVGYEW